MTAAEWIGQALMILFRVISDVHIDDEEKLLPTDIIGRLAHIPTGFLLTRICKIRYNDLFKVSEYINIQV